MQWDFSDTPKLHLDMGEMKAACDGHPLNPNLTATDPECRDMRPCQICQLLQAHFFREGILA